MTEANTPPPQQPSFLLSLVAGGMAGTSVDVALFPIDTIKTRLQAPDGFWKSGGFRGIYNGLSSVVIGSAPGAALFFSVYESLKPLTKDFLTFQIGISETNAAPVSHMVSASVGEAAACLVRVPTEVVKAKMQTTSHANLTSTVRMVLKESNGPLNSVFGGLYRGFGITLFREVPFSMIQFPLYEQMKVQLATYYHQESCTPLQAAACGSASGSVAAALTTPLDVLKTRLMLGNDRDGKPYKNVRDVYTKMLQHEPYRNFWSGLQPRVFWITLGGFVFFGSYEESKKLLRSCGLY